MTETTPTTRPLTVQQLADIEARATAATPGPWEEHADYGPDFYAYLRGPYLRGVGTLNFGDGEDAAADREFVKHARGDVDSLVAEVRRLRARVWELERPAVEAERAKVRESFADLIAAATEARDYEGVFDVECRLREREEQWKREDVARPDAGAELADTRAQVADEVVAWSGRQIGVHVPTVDAIAALLRGTETLVVVEGAQR